MGVENGELGDTPLPRIPRSPCTPPPPPPSLLVNPQSRAWGYEYSKTFLLCNLIYYIADDV